MSDWWEYENLKPAPPEGYSWHPAGRGDHKDDNIDFHVDLGAGKLPKGRLRIDRHGDAEILMNLDTLSPVANHGKTYELYRKNIFHSDSVSGQMNGLPFPNDSIESMISHHCLEHIGDGFIRLMDECYRVLKPGAKFRIIVPLFPSLAAISDPDHVRYFCQDTFESFCHMAGPSDPFWSDVFAEPYTECRFKLTDKDITPPQKLIEIGNDLVGIGELTIDDLFKEPREIRVTLVKP